MMAMHSDLRAPLFWETSFVPENSPADLFRRWLAKGQIIKDIWAFSSEKYVGGLGTFSIFVRHNPRPISKLWSKVND